MVEWGGGEHDAEVGLVWGDLWGEWLVWVGPHEDDGAGRSGHDVAFLDGWAGVCVQHGLIPYHDRKWLVWALFSHA
jgi:hypothetical protein